jgi:hypothetical protein
MIAVPKGDGTTDIWHQNVARNTTDNNTGFPVLWESGYLLNRVNQQRGAVHAFRGLSAGVYGTGAMQINLTSTGSEGDDADLDQHEGFRETQVNEVNLVPDPKKIVEQGFMMNASNAFLSIAMNTGAGQDFYLKWVTVLYRVMARTRPQSEE